MELTSVESTLTGDMDVRGALGVDDEPRNGFERIDVSFRVAGDAPEEKLREVVERARQRSAVYDMVTNGVPVDVEVATAEARRAIELEDAPYQTPAPASWRSPRSSPGSSPPARRSTTATARYPFEAIDALKAAGYFAAPVPVELGGLGVDSAHDLVVASSRLARGDASVAIGVNMHLVAVLNMERRRQVAVAAGAERRARGFASSLEQIARDGVVLAAAISERGQDLTRPGHPRHPHRVGLADRRPQDVLHDVAGRHAPLRRRHLCRRRGHRPLRATRWCPTDAPGVVVHDDWDALGMRASGSNSVSLEGVELPESGVRGGFRAGDPLPYMERNLVAGLFHAAASLGIAESADAVARRGLAGRIDGDARPRMQVADNAVDLAAARGVLSRAAALIDEHRAANPASDGSAEELGALFAEAQAAKAFVNEAAARIVDRALALSGGAGYVNGSPLARAYRDVRAGAFMHPLGANRAYDYLGRVALGEAPPLH